MGDSSPQPKIARLTTIPAKGSTPHLAARETLCPAASSQIRSLEFIFSSVDVGCRALGFLRPQVQNSKSAARYPRTYSRISVDKLIARESGQIIPKLCVEWGFRTPRTTRVRN